nr:MAG TPA: hypothetical protein [Caudoviricetes sp.]
MRVFYLIYFPIAATISMDTVKAVVFDKLSHPDFN